MIFAIFRNATLRNIYILNIKSIIQVKIIKSKFKLMSDDGIWGSLPTDYLCVGTEDECKYFNYIWFKENRHQKETDFKKIMDAQEFKWNVTIVGDDDFNDGLKKNLKKICKRRKLVNCADWMMEYLGEGIFSIFLFVQFTL